MRIESRFVGPGLFLILLGAIPLGVREGFLDSAAVAGAWRLWPLFLVAAGLGLLLRRTVFRELGGILAATLAGVLVGSLLAVGVGGDFGSFACTEAGATPFPARTGSLETTGTTRLDLTVDCGHGRIVTAPGAGWTVAGRSTDGVPPEIGAGPDRLVIRTPARSGGQDGAFPANRWADLALTVPAGLRTAALTVRAGALELVSGEGLADLRATVDAGALTADLGGSGSLASLAVTVNAGSARLTLGDVAVRGSLTVNAGSLALCTPPGVALRLTTKGSALGGYDYGDRGLTEAGGVWTTSGWSSAARLIDLTTTANAGAITLNPEEGCR